MQAKIALLLDEVLNNFLGTNGFRRNLKTPGVGTTPKTVSDRERDTS